MNKISKENKTAWFAVREPKKDGEIFTVIGPTREEAIHEAQNMWYGMYQRNRNDYSIHVYRTQIDKDGDMEFDKIAEEADWRNTEILIQQSEGSKKKLWKMIIEADEKNELGDIKDISNIQEEFEDDISKLQYDKELTKEQAIIRLVQKETNDHDRTSRIIKAIWKKDISPAAVKKYFESTKDL